MYFELLHTRLVDHLRAMVRNGQWTERRLARLTGISQPHLHNVLKGVRVLSAEMADHLVQHLRLSALDLLTEDELGRAGRQGTPPPRYAEAPLLEGRLGPGHPFPDLDVCEGVVPFLWEELAAIARPRGVRLAEDPRAGRLFHRDDMALLAPLPENQRTAEGERPAAGYYAVDLGGSSLIRRVEQRGERLFLLEEDGREDPPCISLADRNILEVLRARVMWIGRYLERSAIADRPFEEAGGQDRPPGGKG